MKIEINEIKTRKDYRATLVRLKELMMAAPGIHREERLEMKLLALLVADYEKKHFPRSERTDPVDMLLFVMENKGITRADLIPCIGTKGKVSEVLNRKVPLSLTMIRRLHATFGIPMNCLAEEYALA